MSFLRLYRVLFLNYTGLYFLRLYKVVFSWIIQDCFFLDWTELSFLELYRIFLFLNETELSFLELYRIFFSWMKQNCLFLNYTELSFLRLYTIATFQVFPIIFFWPKRFSLRDAISDTSLYNYPNLCILFSFFLYCIKFRSRSLLVFISSFTNKNVPEKGLIYFTHPRILGGVMNEWVNWILI